MASAVGLGPGSQGQGQGQGQGYKRVGYTQARGHFEAIGNHAPGWSRGRSWRWSTHSAGPHPGCPWRHPHDTLLPCGCGSRTMCRTMKSSAADRWQFAACAMWPPYPQYWESRLWAVPCVGATYTCSAKDRQACSFERAGLAWKTRICRLWSHLVKSCTVLLCSYLGYLL